jgi:hypothetical protein
MGFLYSVPGMLVMAALLVGLIVYYLQLKKRQNDD